MSTALSSRAPAASRRRLGLAAIIALLLAALALVVAATSGSGGAPLDPQDRGEHGSSALAQALTRRGMTVERVPDAAALSAAEVDGGTTFLVAASSPDPTTTRALVEAVRNAGRVVLVEPDADLLRALDVPARPAGTVRDRLRAGCWAAGISEQDRLAGNTMLYRPQESDRVTTCFTPPRDADTGRPSTGEQDETPGGAYVELPRRGDGRPETVLVGSPDVFTNVGVTSLEQSGVATAALVHGERIVWFLALPAPGEDGATSGGGDGGRGGDTPVPPAFGPSVVLLFAAAATACLWRGRRLGRLVTEPLPVVVHALETTRARAALYQRSGDATGALAVLREAALADLRRSVRLPPTADARLVAHTVAPLVGEDERAIEALLTRVDIGPADLPEHAAALSRLRRKARQP